MKASSEIDVPGNHKLTQEIVDAIDNFVHEVRVDHREPRGRLADLVTLILEAARLDAENKALAIMEAHRAASHNSPPGHGHGY